MPVTPLSDLTTSQLLDIADGSNNHGTVYTPAQAIDEIKTNRIIPNDYEDVALRGGVRPTRPNL